MTVAIIIYILFFCLINRYLIKNIKIKGKAFAVQNNKDTPYLDVQYPVLYNMLFTTNKPNKITSIKKLILDFYRLYRGESIIENKI